MFLHLFILFNHFLRCLSTDIFEAFTNDVAFVSNRSFAMLYLLKE